MLFETGCAPGSKLLEVTAENKIEEKPDSKEGILKKVKKGMRDLCEMIIVSGLPTLSSNQVFTFVIQ